MSHIASRIKPSRPSGIDASRLAVDSFLLDYCQSEARRAANLHPNYGRLWETILSTLQAGGKRLRPSLVIASYEAFGGTDQQAIIRAAAAWELIHIAFLMHDDVIDRDYIRHGQPNVGGQYLAHYASVAEPSDRRHYANSSAILAGDLMVSAAFRLLAGSNFAASQTDQAVELLHDAIFTTTGGELLDVEASAIDIQTTPQLIAEAKTANYSLVGPLLTGAVLAGADRTTQSQLRSLGNVLGVGYQFVDDVLGIYGDQAVTGKPTSSDLQEGKRTFIVFEALKLMDAADRERAEALLHAPSEAAASELQLLIDKTPIQALIRDRINNYHQEAHSLLDKLDIDDDHRAVFEYFISILLDRQA